MTLDINQKWKIKFDEQEQQYIYYRVMTQGEMQAHKAAAEQQLASMQTTLATFDQMINDPRVKPTPEEEPTP